MITLEELKKKGEINVVSQPEKIEPKKKSFGRKIVDFFTASEQAFGQTLGEATAVQTKDVREAQESQTELDNINMRLGLKIAKLKKAGLPTFNLEKVYESNTGRVFDLAEIAPSVEKSTKQIVGEGLGVAADIAAFGKFGKGVGVSKTAGEAFKKGAIKFGTEGLLTGAAFGVSGALKEDLSKEEIIKSGITGGITGGIIGGLVGGFSARSKFLAPQKAAKLKEKAIAQYKKGMQATKEKYKEKSEKIIPELLDKKWWGTRKKLLQKAEKNLALTADEYEKLGELKGVIGIKGIFEKIDDNINKMTLSSGRVSSVNKARVKALTELRADLMAVDALDKMGDGIAWQQKLRELAQDYGQEVYETRKAQKTIMDNKTLSQVKKVDGMIREVLNKDPGNVKYSELNKIYHLNTELAEILEETAFRKEGHKMVGVVRALTGGGGVTGGAVIGGVPGAIIGGVGLTAVGEVLNSTWWNTLRAVQKNALADKLLQQSTEEMSNLLRIFAKQGIKAVEQYLNE